MHTPYSDGTGSHREIAEAAIRAGLDVVLVTDHNVWVQALTATWKRPRSGTRPLGEEIHRPERDPQKDHLLVFGARRELAQYAEDTAGLLSAAAQRRLAFLAHP
jgi:predicted metal-dependent phosphoesterase TrpH